MQKTKVKGQSVRKTEWIQMYRQMETGDCITWVANVVGRHIRDNEGKIRTFSCQQRAAASTACWWNAATLNDLQMTGKCALHWQYIHVFRQHNCYKVRHKKAHTLVFVFQVSVSTEVFHKVFIILKVVVPILNVLLILLCKHKTLQTHTQHTRYLHTNNCLCHLYKFLSANKLG